MSRSLRDIAASRRTNITVVAAVATAVAVLCGALLVVGSVHDSLVDLASQRIGATDLVVSSDGFLAEQLANDLRADPEFDNSFSGAVPIVSSTGVVIESTSGRRVAGAQVYAVDDRFWRFHGLQAHTLGSQDILLSEALASAVGAEPGGEIVLQVPTRSPAPLESIHRDRADSGRAISLSTIGVLPSSELGGFSLATDQDEVLAAFVSLKAFQQELGIVGRVNAILVSSNEGSSDASRALKALLQRHLTVEDIGLTLRILDPQGVLALEAPGGVIDDRRAYVAIEAATPLELEYQPVLTYFVNAIRLGDREVPYSLVTATDIEDVGTGAEYEDGAAMPIAINDWLAKDLGADVGDPLTLEYFVWQDPGGLATEQATAVVSRVLPLQGIAADRDFAPAYSGITGTENIRDWQPPFPIDRDRIRPIDEQYWDRYRTAPKAFMPLGAGATLWRTRHGAMTSIRFTPPPGMSPHDAEQQFRDAIRRRVDPVEHGLKVRDVRGESVIAARRGTELGRYVVYLSLLPVLAALILAMRSARRANGDGRLNDVSGATWMLALTGTAIGTVAAPAYTSLMLAALRTWWIDAIGTRALSLHVSVPTLAIGAATGFVVALLGLSWVRRGGKANAPFPDDGARP